MATRTLYFAVANAGLSLAGDVAEAYAWGREFQLGYYKHPPFWVWIAGLWFQVFPTRAWAFDLLATLNSAIGLLGCWLLIGVLSKGWERLAAFTLLLLTPFYTFLCDKYNANSIFLSLWPWTLFFLLTSIETRRRSHALWFGVLLAAGLLSKYYAITLDITCLLASILHASWRDYWRSPCPYISLLVCTLLVLPHLIWVVRSDAPTVAYAMAETDIGLLRSLYFGLAFLASMILLHILVLLLVLTCVRSADGIRLSWSNMVSDRVLPVLVLTPPVLTVLFGLGFELKISSNMSIGTFPLLPLLVMRVVPQLDPQLVFRRTACAAVAIMVASLLGSPAIAYVEFMRARRPEAREPRRELAQYVTQVWHAEMGTRLQYVAGSDPYENAIAFYSTDHPTVFTLFDRHKAPWLSPRRLAAVGMAAVCVQGDGACERAAASFMTLATQTVVVSLQHVFWGNRQAPVTFDIHLIPPQLHPSDGVSPRQSFPRMRSG